MDLTRALLIRYVALVAGVGLGFVIMRAVGLDPSLGWAVLVFVACAAGSTWGIVGRRAGHSS